MRTPEEIHRLRVALNNAYAKPGLHATQKAGLGSMLTVAAWADGAPSLTVDLLLSGEPVVPKTDAEVAEVVNTFFPQV